MHLQIPPAIQVPGAKPALYLYAIGVQQYSARPVAGQPGQFEWNPRSRPEADLFDADGRLVGTHFADDAAGGPAWLCAADQSRVVANVATAKRADGRSSIAWLLLDRLSGTTGDTMLGGVRFIQRVETVGGVAPAAPPLRPDATARVYYTATYIFTF